MDIPPVIRAILFDAVGTLIYPNPPPAEVYHREGQKIGSSYSVDEVASRFRAAIQRHHQGGATSEELERERWRKIVYDVIDDVKDPYGSLINTLWDHFGSPPSWHLFDDVAPAWQELTSRGYLIGIASNFDGRLRSICRSHPPLDECRHIFASSEVGFPKPEPAFYRAVEEQLALRPEQILLIGDDQEADVIGPTAAGWQARWLRRDRGESLADFVGWAS